MVNTYFIDTETCGLHGVPVLIQYAMDNGPVCIHHIWTEPIHHTLNLIQKFVDGRVVAHNLRFDWFHLQKIYNTLRLLQEHAYAPKYHDIQTIVEAEYNSRNGPCLKPMSAICTMLLAQKGEFQSMIMDAKPVRVRRIPVGMAERVKAMLNKNTKLPWILFANRQKPGWEICDRKNDETGEIDPFWKDIQLKFAPSVGLKDLAKFLLNHEPSAKFDEIALPEEFMPRDKKLGFAPYAALLTSASKKWEYDGFPMWPALLEKHIEHWANDEAALAYAEDDIVMLRKLYHHFGSPTEDQDGMLACQVASCRLRGFAINADGMKEECNKSMKVVAGAKINVNSPKQVMGYVAEALDPMEHFWLANGCDKKVMAKMRKEYVLDEQEDCVCEGGRGEDGKTCVRCGGVGTVGPGAMPVVGRLDHIENVRKHKKRVELFDKLVLAGRAYADFRVIGAKSGRMSGTSGLNFQGIDSDAEVRSLFTFADPGWILSAGDYSSQEVAIAATTMNDEDLMVDMKTGKSLHCLFCCEVFDCTYEEALAWKSDEHPKHDLYKKAKSGVFLILYGGTFETLARNLDLELEVAESGFKNFIKKYPQVGKTRAMIADRFSSITQPGGRGTKIIYNEPAEKFIESIFGFRRYFDVEYTLQKTILDLAQDMPSEWKAFEVKVVRSKDYEQTIAGAIASALYGAAFSLQNKIIRAANNHLIQSAGRTLTMGIQAAVWDLQPQGIHPFQLALMSVHDELAVVSKPDMVNPIREAIEAKVAEQREVIPLTRIEWFSNNRSWVEKGSGQNMVGIGWSPEEEGLLVA